uniref:G-protein coupled receptors family 1 profile domain-containing protein n=1 Tax=Panagrolaimus sp. JU765 TaxID=591449 RepID=A0AC34RIL6_9BILA
MSNNSIDLVQNFDWNVSDFDIDAAKALGKNQIDDETSFRVLIALIVVSAAILGLIVNFFILVLSLFRIHGDYRHFVANLAVIDIIGALLFAFMGYLNLGDRQRFSVRVMTYSAFAFYGSFGVMVCGLVPISLSRVFAASKPKVYNRLFSGKRAFAICIVSDFSPVALLAIICIARHDVGKWLFFSYAVLTFSAYVVTFVSNSIVFRIVAKHIPVVQSLHDKTRLLETRQVAAATLAQALVPIVCQVPAFLTLSAALLLVEPVTDANVIVVTQLWLAASPLFDGLITLFVIKQYRDQTIVWFTTLCNAKMSKGKPCTITTRTAYYASTLDIQYEDKV